MVRSVRGINPMAKEFTPSVPKAKPAASTPVVPPGLHVAPEGSPQPTDAPKDVPNEVKYASVVKVRPDPRLWQRWGITVL